ncbi:TetR/AcrR family transcriptional regulator [Sporichthya brevicatena]|uniref:TetR/AcrR family transcriptional regulator n=1 Tax=Sporichthya brevicatena TaxID=171442 RepID=UPI0031CDF7A5
MTVFAREGYQGTSIQDVAAEADVVTTAVYYHFSSKDELYEAALESVFRQLDEVVEEAREPEGELSFSRVMGAVWDWVENNPEPAKLLYHQLPGATANSLQIRQEFERRHIERMVDYLKAPSAPSNRRDAALRWTTLSLIMRSVFALGTNMHSLRLGDGPLAGHSEAALRKAYEEVSLSMMAAAEERS